MTAGGRERLDGLLLLDHAGDLADSRAPRAHLPGHGVQILRALRGHHGRHEQCGRRR